MNLHTSMDDSSRLPAKTQSASDIAAAPNPVLIERDYRGVVCPMNYVKVLYDFAKMQKGQCLRVLLDDGAPIENVPRSVAQDGHKVLEQTKVGSHWSVLFEKS